MKKALALVSLPALVVLLLFAGCASPREAPASPEATLVLFRADSNVRDPAANDAHAGVRRIDLRAIDGKIRPDAVLRLSDRAGVPVGEHTLLFAAESSTGTTTLSELRLRFEAGVDYAVRPEETVERGILVRVRRGAYGEVVGVSTPWRPPEESSPEATPAKR